MEVPSALHFVGDRGVVLFDCHALVGFVLDWC